MQRGENSGPRSVPRPPAKLGPDPGPGTELPGQEAPLAPGVRDVEHCVDDAAQVGAVLRSSFGGNQQQRFQYLPLVIGQVTRIGHDLMVTVVAPGAHAN